MHINEPVFMSIAVDISTGVIVTTADSTPAAVYDILTITGLGLPLSLSTTAVCDSHVMVASLGVPLF